MDLSAKGDSKRPVSILLAREAQERIIGILAPEGAVRISLFGSRARGDSSAASDLDLLVRFEKTPSLFRLAELEERLADELGVPVDVITERSLGPYYRDSILREARVIHG